MKKLVEEVRNYIEESFGDYCAEEYDARFNYKKYNEACRKIHIAKENGEAHLIDTELDIDDFSVVCALFRTGIWK